MINEAHPHTHGINPWLIAGTVMLATFMEVLDTSIANVALPHIAGNLSAGTDESTWVLTSYLVSNAIILPMGGWFSSLIGRKRFYMICVALFTVASALCGLAPTLGSLIFFRILQGIGGGALQPISQAIVVESFPREKQGLAMAFYGLGVVVAPVIGPTLGGWITDNYSWRWIFFINIPIGVLSLLLTSGIIKDPVYLVRKKLGEIKIDYLGFALLSLGLGALEIVLDEGQREDWFSSNFIIVFSVIAVVALIGMVFWELRQEDPVVDLHVLRDRNFTLSTMVMFVMGVALYGSTMLLPLFMQSMMGYTATWSGMAVSPGGIAIACLMPVVGVLIAKGVDARWLVLFGIVVCSTGMFMMSHFTLQMSFANAVQARIVQSCGLAFLFIPVNTVSLSYISRDRVNRATGIINLARNIGGSTGIALVTTLIARRAQYHQNVLVSHLTPADGRYNDVLHQVSGALVAKGASMAQAAAQAQGVVYGMLVKQANLLAMVDGFWAMAVSFFAIAPLLFFMKKTKPHKGNMAAH